jgi:DNA-binding CsgD family transcriptional regulator
MDRLTSKQLRDLLDFLRAGYACHEQEAFITHLLSGLSTLIPSEVTSYGEVDLRTGWVGDISITPAEAGFSGHRDIFAAHMAEHPIPTYFRQTGNGQAVKISDFLTQRQFHRLGLYQELFRRVGLEDQMAVSLAGPGSSEIGITLGRSRRSFTERERLLLELLRPHLAQVYANAQAAGAMRQEVSVLQQGLERSGQEMVVLSREGRLRRMTPRAHDWLTTYFGPTRAEQLPEALRAWVSHQEAVLGRADDVPPAREPLRVQRDGTCLLVRHLCEAEQCLLLLEEQQTAVQSVSFEQDGLTRREAEVLQWVAQGKTNAEIGDILGISIRTVQKHLEHVYEKLGVETRTAAATVALGWRAEGVGCDPWRALNSSRRRT